MTSEARSLFKVIRVISLVPAPSAPLLLLIETVASVIPAVTRKMAALGTLPRDLVVSSWTRKMR